MKALDFFCSLPNSFVPKFKLKLMNFLIKPILFVICFYSGSSHSRAQIMQAENYPQHYFQWPLNLVPALAANFGELRPNHYHMGLDCRTAQKQNQAVLASAEGYIAKVKIEPFGFGRCIYINHPNGFTTVYAHLNDFNPELEKYVTTQQYLHKTWKVFLDIPTNLFPVKRGQFIAYSGNTGGSQGPHLHFEIRETKTEKVLNPLLFGMAIKDNIAPDLLRLAIYDRSFSTYEQSPQLYALKKIGGNYTTSPALILINANKVSFGISAFDRITGSTNRNGIFQAILFDNEVPVVGFRLNSIGYEETRYLNAHIDYKLRSNGGPFVQHLSRLPGYTSGIYKIITGDGVIRLTDDSVHKISVEVKDANGNTSMLSFNIKKNISISKKNAVALTAPGEQKWFYPGLINVFDHENIGFYLPEKCLYDSFLFQYNEIRQKGGNTIYSLYNNSVPLHVPFPLKIRSEIPASLKDKVVIVRTWNAKKEFAKGVPVSVSYGDWFVASFREFGNFQLQVDTTSPVINPLGFKDGMNLAKHNQLAFAVTDNSEELKDFTATLDGKWLRFSNDKGRAFIYKFDENCRPGKHELIISAEDIVGNKTIKVYHFVK